MYYQVIPHTTLQIRFIGTAAVTLLPAFKGAVAGQFKRVRHFYGMDNLSDFYTPDAAMSALVDSDISANLVYGPGIDLDELPAKFDYPGFTGPQQDFFDLEQDSVKLAADRVKWNAAVDGMTGLSVLPYVVGAGALSRVAAGKLNSTAVAGDSTPTEHQVGVAQTLLFDFVSGTTHNVVHVNVLHADFSAALNILDPANSDVLREIFGNIPVPGTPAKTCSVAYSAEYDKVTVTFNAQGSGMTLNVYSIDKAESPAFPDDPTISAQGFYLTSKAVSKASYQVLRGIQGYGDVVAGTPYHFEPDSATDEYHMFAGAEVDSDYGDHVWKLTSNYEALVTADYFSTFRVYGAYYTFSSTSFYGVDLGGIVPEDKQLQVDALSVLAAETHPVTEDSVFCCDVHVEYKAVFVPGSAGNTYANRVYVSNASESQFPIADGNYKWGLPHPDNPVGFAASITRTLLATDANYFFVVLADDKAKAFDLAAAEIPRILFIANVWDEFGQGGLSEDGYLATLETTQGKYPALFTWMNMNPIIDKRGTEDAPNAYPGSATVSDYYLYKHGSDVNFTASPAVEAGDIVELTYADDSTQLAIVTGVEASRIRLSKRLSGTASDINFYIYKRMTSAAAKDYYNSRMASSKFNLWVNLNQGIQWGSHLISNKWIVPAMMAMRLVNPEQQPMTGVTLDFGKFGVAYGGKDFFEMGDLDGVVANGFYVLVTDPEAGASYVIRDVTAGIKSQDYRRGNGNAATPILTFAASCRAVLDRLTGKYNKGPFLVQKAQMALAAVEASYIATPPVPDFGAKLFIARFKELRGVTGGYAVIMEAQPQEQANIFEIIVDVIQEEEA